MSTPETKQLDPTLLQEPEGIYSGSTSEVIGKLTLNRIGIGVFPQSDLELVTANLVSLGYIPDDLAGSSTASGGEKGVAGELHRHDDSSVIVHRTLSGMGSANFFWPVDDDKGYDPDFWFDPSTDVVHLKAHTKVLPEQIIVFPANTWHQFGTDPGQSRSSYFRHYRPSS